MEDLEPQIETWVDDNGMVAVSLSDAGIIEHGDKLSPAIAFEPMQAVAVAKAILEKAYEALLDAQGDEEDEDE